MKLLVSVACLFLLGVVSVANAAAGRVIYVEGHSENITAEQIANALPAWQSAIADLASAWDVDATLVQGDAPEGAWSIELTDFADCWMCSGYHAVSHGVPYAKVVVDLTDPVATSVTLTHELEEMLVDPFPDMNGNGGRFVKAGKRMYLVEVSDPCEDKAFAYFRPGADGFAVAISDFVTPAYYRRGAKGPYDFMGHVRRPLQVLPGGYVSWIEGGKWRQVTNWFRHSPDGWSWGD